MLPKFEGECERTGNRVEIRISDSVGLGEVRDHVPKQSPEDAGPQTKSKVTRPGHLGPMTHLYPI